MVFYPYCCLQIKKKTLIVYLMQILLQVAATQLTILSMKSSFSVVDYFPYFSLLNRLCGCSLAILNHDSLSYNCKVASPTTYWFLPSLPPASCLAAQISEKMVAFHKAYPSNIASSAHTLERKKNIYSTYVTHYSKE